MESICGGGVGLGILMLNYSVMDKIKLKLRVTMVKQN